MITYSSFFKHARRKSYKFIIFALALACGLMLFPESAYGYVCGDHNGDGQVNIGDAVHTVNYVFRGGPACDPAEAGDANCDGDVNVGDAVSIINRVFRNGLEPCCVCPPIDQPFLFEMCYSNYAWGHIFQGYYVDNAGQVIQYNYTGSIPYASPWYTEVTGFQLELRYSQNPVMVNVISHNELYQHYAAIAAAAEGELSPPTVACFDFGAAYYVAYIHNEETDIYQPVLLYQFGDWAQKNFAPEAEALLHWMMSLVGDDPDNTVCGFPGD